MKRKRKWGLVSFFLLALAGWLYWGNESIGTTVYEIENPKVSENLAGFTLVQVSDLHNKKFGANQQQLLRKVAAQNPDIIAVTGDLIDGNKPNVAAAMAFIEEAVKIAPVYYVTGNHEYWTGEYESLREQLIQSGVHMMDGNVKEITYNGDIIRMIGVEDPMFNVYQNEDQKIDAELKTLAQESERYTILLSHRPELFTVYVENKLDLVLTGHAHGGQIRIPFLGGLVAPNQGWLPTYTSGTFKAGETEMVVSRGLGNSIIPLRVNNRSELVVVKLRVAE